MRGKKRMKRMLAVVGLFNMFWISALSFSQINLLQNPGFEDWSDNVPVSWTKESGVTLTQESSIIKSGSYSAKILRGASSNGGIEQEAPVSGGSAYTFKSWVYDAGGTAKAGIIISWYNGDTYLSYSGPVYSNTENTWEQIVLSKTAPTSATKALCRIREYTSNDSPCYADDAEFYADTPLSVKVSACYAVCGNHALEIHWKTESEMGTLGFHVLRADRESGPFYLLTTALIPGIGNASSGSEYVFLDKNVDSGKSYWYQIEELEENGNRTIVGTVQADLQSVVAVPLEARMFSNYPNPFNPSTVIHFEVSSEEAKSDLSLSIHDMLGRKIRILIEGVQKPGEHKAIWDGRDSSGRDAESGLYFCVLKCRSRMAASIRMLKLK